MHNLFHFHKYYYYYIVSYVFPSIVITRFAAVAAAVQLLYVCFMKRAYSSCTAAATAAKWVITMNTDSVVIIIWVSNWFIIGLWDFFVLIWQNMYRVSFLSWCSFLITICICKTQKQEKFIVVKKSFFHPHYSCCSAVVVSTMNSDLWNDSLF